MCDPFEWYLKLLFILLVSTLSHTMYFTLSKIAEQFMALGSTTSLLRVAGELKKNNGKLKACLISVLVYSIIADGLPDSFLLFLFSFVKFSLLSFWKWNQKMCLGYKIFKTAGISTEWCITWQGKWLGILFYWPLWRYIIVAIIILHMFDIWMRNRVAFSESW